MKAITNFYFLVYSYVVVCKALQYLDATIHLQRLIFYLRMRQNRLAAAGRAICAPLDASWLEGVSPRERERR